MSKIIGCDIDGVVCDTNYLWYTYLLSRYKLKVEYYGVHKFPYNVSEMFHIPDNVDPFVFWKDPYLYEGLEPVPNSVDILHKLCEEGNKIRFVSFGKGFHQKSKYYFIEKWFPFKEAVVLTKEKWTVGMDIMIDDSTHILDSMPENVLTIKFREDTIQPEAKRKHMLAMDWKDVYNICTNKEEK